MAKKSQKKTTAPVAKATTETTAPVVTDTEVTTDTTATETQAQEAPQVASTEANQEDQAPKQETGKTEVTVISPFYDLEAKKDRRAGETYKTTAARATKLRSRSLVK